MATPRIPTRHIAEPLPLSRLAPGNFPQGNLAEARKMTADVPQASRPLLLPALHASLWLDRLAAVGHDVFDPALQISPVSPLGYQLRLKWAMLQHRF